MANAKKCDKCGVLYDREWTLYVVEDISGADVSPYHYEINFIPEMIVPFEFELGE